MNTNATFWTVALAIFLFFAGLGFGVVPNWVSYFQTPDQRYSYLIESIWCPI